jgi:hypothetical protein
MGDNCDREVLKAAKVRSCRRSATLPELQNDRFGAGPNFTRMCYGCVLCDRFFIIIVCWVKNPPVSLCVLQRG